jgi:hypothetical protein
MGTWLVMALILLVLAIVVILLIIKNRKDKKEFEDQLKQDYRKPGPHDVEDEGADRM